MPYKELKRLEAVNRFLQIHIDKQQEFEEISQLAADICGVNSALITLIGSDVEYVLAEDRFVSNSERIESFCHYVVESERVVIVPDALLDAKFKDYAAVTREKGIRFYAGAPLTAYDGQTLGSLCVIDQKPGQLTQIQTEMLQNLATQVVQLLEFESNLHLLKQQYLSAKKLELKMNSFFESTTSSHLLLDKDLNVICYNKAVEIFIKKAHDIDIQVGMSIKDFVYSTYIQDFIQNCELALSGESIRKERLMNFAGYSVWWLISYDPARNSDGEIVGISFNSSDISKKIESQQTALAQQRKLEHIAYMQSHEFRSPVATIKGLLYLMEKDGYTESYPALKVIENSINDIDDRIVEIVNFTVIGENS